MEPLSFPDTSSSGFNANVSTHPICICRNLIRPLLSILPRIYPVSDLPFRITPSSPIHRHADVLSYSILPYFRPPPPVHNTRSFPIFDPPPPFCITSFYLLSTPPVPYCPTLSYIYPDVPSYPIRPYFCPRTSGNMNISLVKKTQKINLGPGPG